MSGARDRAAATLPPEAEDEAALDVTAVQPDGRKRVAFRLFSGRNERRLEPGQGYRNNPLIVVFLQRDVEQMGRLTGGSPQYFRNRIREAFGRDGAVSAEPVTVAFRERRLEGTKVTVEPFARDPNLLRFPEYARKRYEFVLAPDIPGGTRPAGVRTSAAPTSCSTARPSRETSSSTCAAAAFPPTAMRRTPPTTASPCTSSSTTTRPRPGP